MTTRSTSRWLLLLAAAFVVVASFAVSLVPVKTIADASAAPAADDGSAKMRAELVELADAWALGGGTYGYPFWDKAGQRWKTGQITTTMYREYVDGYRDRLRAGCELLDAIDTSEQMSGDVRKLVLDSCRTRVEALRSQHRWLEASIDQDYSEPNDDPAALQELADTHELEYREAIQDSFRDARLAMNTAQFALDDAGLDRLPEGAFI